MGYAGWIYFNNEKARNYLLFHGYVYTIRERGRKEGWGYAKYGRENLGKVLIRKIAPASEAYKYYKESGFNSIGEWYKAVRAMGKNPKYMDIYRVDMI